MYQFPVIGRDTSYFVKSQSKSNNEYKQDKIIQMLGKHISPVWWFNRLLVCTNCAPLLVDLFVHAYDADFVEVKDATDTQESVSYLDLHLEIGNGGILEIKLYDKRDDFIFVIVNFPFISSNISYWSY